MASSGTVGKDRAKLAERLQRLKADLEKSKRATKNPPAQTETTLQDSKPAGIPFNPVPEQKASSHVEDVPAPSPPAHCSDPPLTVKTAQSAVVQDSEFEVVSSPLETYQDNTGSSPRSNASIRQDPSGSEAGGSIAAAGKPENEQGRGATGGEEGEGHSDLERQLAEEREQRQDLEDQVYALRQAYSESRDSSEGLGGEVERLQREVDSLRNQLQRASTTSLKQARQEEADNMRSRLERAEKAIEQERAASAKLRSQLEESQNQAILNAEAAARFGPLQAALKEAKRKVQEGEKQLETLGQANSGKEVQIRELQAWKEAQESAFKQQKAELKGLADRLREAGTSHAALQSRVNVVEGEKQRLAAEVGHLRRQVEQQPASDQTAPLTAPNLHVIEQAEQSLSGMIATAMHDPPVQPAQPPRGPAPPLEALAEPALAQTAGESAAQEAVGSDISALPSTMSSSNAGPKSALMEPSGSHDAKPGASVVEAKSMGAVGGKEETVIAKPKGLWAFITGADKAVTTPVAR